jgi:hypothetical protein
MNYIIFVNKKKYFKYNLSKKIFKYIYKIYSAIKNKIFYMKKFIFSIKFLKFKF